MLSSTLLEPRHAARFPGPDVVRHDLVRAAEIYGTPVYVIDQPALSRAAARVERAFGDPWLRQYSLKANDLPAVTAVLAARGWGANVVSTGEWRQARLAGLPDRAVTFEGIGKTDRDLEVAVRSVADGAPLRWLALESAEEAERLVALASSYRLGTGGRAPLDVLVRLNPQVQPETIPELAVGSADSKFGMTPDEIRSLVPDLRCDGIRLRGVHVHAGSDLRDVAGWAAAGVHAVRLLWELAETTDSADTVDFGGGFPADGLPDAPGPAQFRASLEAALRQAGLALPRRCAVEPGRAVVGAAGWLVSSVLHSRSRPGQPRQVVLDAGMTELIRPALYGSRHPVHAMRESGEEDGVPGPTVVEGPVCESTDTFGAHHLPPLARGDLVAIERAGAYAASFTSRYNGRPQPVEVMRAADGTLRRAARAELGRADGGIIPQFP